MARNLPIAFGAILVGGVLLDAAIKGASVADVIKGQAQMSSAGTTTASPVVGSGGAVNPFAQASKLVGGRTDQGVDFTLNPGDPILAPFAGTITAVNPGWYAGQPQVVLAGAPGTPFAGKFLYVAEQLVPHVKPGDTVAAGQRIATYAQSGTGGEIGWAAGPNGQTLADAQGYAPAARAGQSNPAGNSIKAFLSSLGAGL